MKWKRWIYGLPMMRWYRFKRAREIASVKRLTPDGFMLAGHDYVYQAEWEPLERATIRSALADADALIDVGANDGYYAVMAAEMGKDVLAIEPDEVNLVILRANLGDRGEIFAGALSDRPGTATLFGDGDYASFRREWSGAGRMFRQTVQTATLDGLLRDRWPGRRLVIKIDVEGAEALVLAGAPETLRRSVTWIIETAPQLPNGAPNDAYQQTLNAMAGFDRTDLNRSNFMFSLPKADTAAT
nr:FkbM family methyltransferase [uncultured Sphingomonas sp.]